MIESGFCSDHHSLHETDLPPIYAEVMQGLCGQRL